MVKNKIFLFFIFICVLVSPVFGYIDPGTGSLLVSTLLGVGLTLIFSLRGVFYRLINRFTGGRIKKSFDFSEQLVFFNEGKNYWNTFKPVLFELIKREQNFVYLTTDEDDPGLMELPLNIEKFCLGSIQRAVVILNTLKADTVVMTTPQLGILHLKRSKNVRHYSHLLHAPCDIHTYKKFAFDYFDSVLCSGPFQIENIKQLEKKRNKAEKKLLKTGCVYYDVSKKIDDHEGSAILLAPTWGSKSFFSEKGVELIESILDGGHTLVFRPHPQSWISEKELIENVQKRFKKNPLFSLDDATSNEGSLKASNLMICDFSGVVYDYLFLRRKPVIAISRDWADGGYESSDIEKAPDTVKLIEEGGSLLRMDQLKDINKIIMNTRTKIIEKELVDKHIYNFGEAAPVAVNHILEIYKERK